MGEDKRRNAGRKSKNSPATEEEIIAVGKQKALQNPVYKGASLELSANEEAIGRIIGFAREGVENVIANGGKIRLDDAEAIKAITWRYLDICSKNGIPPSMTGLSMAIGCTIHALEDHKRRHPQSETTAWLNYIKDVFAEILSQTMLAGKSVAIPSIFVLKARYGWKDDPVDNLGEQKNTESVDAKTIMEKYSDLPE